jgi:hypothetical protein
MASLAASVGDSASLAASIQECSNQAARGVDSASPAPPPPTFAHPKYELVGCDRISRRADAAPPASRGEHIDEEESVLAEIVRFVTCSMLSLGFKEVWIPDEGAVARCPVYCSNGWDQAARLLVILTNQVGAHKKG